MGIFIKILPAIPILILAGIGIELGSTQYLSERSIPETVQGCYRNTTAYDRFKRQPMHIENLIAIIRKIENRMQNQWDMRRVARHILKRYQFDGMRFDPRISDPDLAFHRFSKESQKQTILHMMIAGDQDILPDGVLDNDDKCALHWMLSTSLNATVRDDDMGLGYNPGSSGGGGGGYNPPNYNPGYPNNNPPQYPPSSGQRRHRRDIGEDPFKDDEFFQPEEKPEEKKEVEEKAEEDNIDDDVETVGESNSKSSEEPSKAHSGAPKFARQVNVGGRQEKSNTPIETGAVYTDWGTISVGRVIGGLLAGLEPTSMPVGSFNSPAGSPEFPGFGNNNPPNYPPSNQQLPPAPGSGNGPFGNNPGQSGGYPPSGGGFPPYNNGPNPPPSGGRPEYPGQVPFPPQGQYPPTKSNQGSHYGRKKRQAYNQNVSFQNLQNIHAATLAGDIGQGAILNALYANNFAQRTPPTGQWNDTICPREFILDPVSYDPTVDFFRGTWSVMTGAEILGGVDGLILGLNIHNWNNLRSGLKLSDVLEQYYSEKGISGDTRFRACNRNSLYQGIIDMNVLREQSRSFAFLYNNRTQFIDLEDFSKFENLVNIAMDSALGFASQEGGKFPCKRREQSGSQIEINDNEKYTEIKNTIFAVVDYTTSYEELDQQLRFLGQLAHEIRVSPRGARMGIVHGGTGYLTINPNATDNLAVLSCNILGMQRNFGSQYQIPQVLTQLKSEIQKIKDNEERFYENLGVSNGITVLFMVQGKRIEEGQRGDIRRMIDEYRREYGDVHIMFASSKFASNDFENIVPNINQDYIKIRGSYNLSSDAEDFVKQFEKKGGHGKLQYPKCNVNRYEQDNEHKLSTELYITPGNIQYYLISPDYFYSARHLLLRFSSDNGKVRICHGRNWPFPSITNDAWCKETTGSYVAAGAADFTDVQFDTKKPCGSNGERDGCEPIYISITPTSFGTQGSLGLDCSVEACESSNQVKVSFSHWDMRCNTNGAIYTTLSPILVLLISFLYTFQWNN